jgi:DNA-binding SARP family transcriptional activator
MSSFQLSVTEITAPNPSKIQPRSRLFSAIDELCANPILWIGGPPGCGKTALIAGYLSARGLASTWCRLRAGSGAALPASVTLRDFCARASRPGCIVVEDCHRIAAAALGDFATECAAGTPPGLRMILIGRGEPPASLMPLIVKGSIGTLSGSDLRCSAEEMREWAASINAIASALSEWHEKCQGWALGIARALETLRRDPANPAQAFEKSRQELFAYFAAEVFERTTPCERQVLVSAAIVARGSYQTAETLSGIPETSEVLARIARQHGFTACSPGMPPTYQFMPLFREFLLTRISDTFPPPKLRTLAMRTTALLEEGPRQNWLDNCRLLEAYYALRRADRTSCHQLLCTALNDPDFAAQAAQACALFPSAVAQVCAEALRESIAPECARHLIERHRLPAPELAGRHWPWPFKVYVLGRFRLLKADMAISFSRRAQRKTLELLQALIAFGATEVPARALIDALWPDSEGDAGYHALESALYRLRQLLGVHDAVRMASSSLSLNRSLFWVDLWEFEHELKSVRDDATNLADRVGRIRQLYEGHFLQHESEQPWALQTRQASRDRFLRCMRDAARVYESRNLWHEAAKVYQSSLELDVLSEDLHRGLIVCHRELGDHSEALHAYRRCRELLTKFLGVPPNAKTQAIYHSVRERAGCDHP